MNFQNGAKKSKGQLKEERGRKGREGDGVCELVSELVRYESKKEGRSLKIKKAADAAFFTF